MARSITIVTIIFVLILSILFVNNGISQEKENSSILYIKQILHKNDTNLTAYKIETDFDNNYIVIYGNESKDAGWYAFGPDFINISKFDTKGNLIWDYDLTDNFWTFGMDDLQIDTENNIHIILWHHGWCGNEAPSFEYLKLSYDGEELYYKSFPGNFVQMRIYEDNSVGILYFFPYDELWYYNEDKPENITGEMGFIKISNEIDTSISIDVTFIPRAFLIENYDQIIIISNSTWRLPMSGKLLFIANLTNEFSVSGTVTAKGSYFIFKGFYDIKLLKLSNDYMNLEIYRTLLNYEYYSENKTIVKFDKEGSISIIQYYNGNISNTIIEPISNTSNSNLIDLNGKRLIDSTYESNNSMVLLLSDGDSDKFGIEVAKNIFLGSQTINFIDNYLDSDNDGYKDSLELVEGTDPYNNKSIPEDFDNDLIPNSIDNDNDNDGFNDTIELSEGTDPFNSDSTPLDLDQDFLPDTIDPDIDGDDVPNEDDDYPYDLSKWEKNEIDNTAILSALIGVVLIIILFVMLFLFVKKQKQDKKD